MIMQSVVFNSSKILICKQITTNQTLKNPVYQLYSIAQRQLSTSIFI